MRQSGSVVLGWTVKVQEAFYINHIKAKSKILNIFIAVGNGGGTGPRLDPLV